MLYVLSKVTKWVQLTARRHSPHVSKTHVLVTIGISAENINLITFSFCLATSFPVIVVYFRFRSKPIPKACNFYGQIMFTSIYVYTELGQKYGPFGDFDDPDREYENFSVGGQYCRLQYLSGKTERNEREQWITQLGKLPRSSLPSDAHNFLAGRAKTTFEYDFMFLRISLGIYFWRRILFLWNEFPFDNVNGTTFIIQTW